MAVLSRDALIGTADIRAALGRQAGDAVAPGDAGIESAVEALLARFALEAPGTLDDGTLHERVIAEVERPLIRLMLARNGNNQLRTARALGINRNTLRKRLDMLGIEVGRSG
jgi:two-component system nitrogen regulation response regulator GlnG